MLKTAVLVSGGVESSSLVLLASKHFSTVYPVYVNFSTFWTNAELDHLKDLLPLIKATNVKPLKVLDMPVDDIYGSHWSITGKNTPDSSTPDEAVYLPGRNLLLLAKVSTWCALNDIPAIILGTSKSNPFADTSAGFFEHIKCASEIALNSKFDILSPLAHFTKAEAMSLQQDIPWEKTFSCINPIANSKSFVHCGKCNKCGERQKAFLEMKIHDPTMYANKNP